MEYGKYKEQWIKLLSAKRFNAQSDKRGFVLQDPGPREGRTPFEADIGRVVFSQPFRRLAGKTQVHPFSSIDYVHNRLTHSNEVAYVSRALGRRVAKFILKNAGDLESDRQIELIGWICQAAGMMHDIGNPPYGHAGEDAIRAWGNKNEDELTNVCGKEVCGDICHFDGNAQAFRMASRPGLRESCYFKFTAATLGAMVKYPWLTSDKRSLRKNKSSAFSTEKQMFDALKEELGLVRGQRHPLSYLTEAADDICYRVNDFEDAVIMGLMEEGEVKELLLDGMTFENQQLHKQKYEGAKGFVHCAGFDQMAPLGMIKDESVQRLFAIHAGFPIQFLGWMAKKGNHAPSSAAVLISSLSAHEGAKGHVAYAAAKGAVEGVLSPAAAELAPKCIRLNAVVLGVVQTEMAKGWLTKLTPEQYKQIADGYPLGMGNPEDVAKAIAFLLSDDARWITGQTLICDGGHSLA